MRRGTISWGAFLILFGVLFLLDNLNVINVNIWGLFWPLLLIWFGLQMLWGYSRRDRDAGAEFLSIPIKGIEEAHIRINYGAGELQVHGDTAPEYLLDGEFGSGVDYDLREAGDNTVDLKLRSPSESFFSWPWWGAGESRRWNFGLNDALPLSLEVSTGASKTVLDLSRLQVKALQLKTGASETNVTLPAHAGFTEVSGETGLAAVRFRVPEGVAARIRTSGGLSEINVDQDRFSRTGSGYQSADYDTAENRVDIDISVGLGSASIR